jgi:hypothetical protein
LAFWKLGARRRFGHTPPRCSCGWQAPAEKRKKATRQVQHHMKTCEVRLVHADAKTRWAERFSA